MHCDIFQDQYLLLDKHEPMPTGLKMHLLCCSSCRQAVNRIAAAENVQRHILHTPIVGTFLILGFILLPFSDMGKIDLSQFGDSFWIPFALLCAGSIVTYSAVFLAKNLVFFTEKFTPQV